MNKLPLPPVSALLLGAALALATPGLQAQEVARVIASVPVIQQVAVPRQVCTTQQVMVEQPKSGAGALLGAVAGGAMGNQVGQGSGRALATMIGLVGGSMLGDKIEGPGAPEVRNVQNCTTQTFYENRTIGYNVVYEFAGKQYTVQMPQDPGPTLQVQITPVVPGVGATTISSGVQWYPAPQPVQRPRHWR